MNSSQQFDTECWCFGLRTTTFSTNCTCGGKDEMDSEGNLIAVSERSLSTDDME